MNHPEGKNLLSRARLEAMMEEREVSAMGEFPSKFKLERGHKCRLAILGLSSADSQTS